MGEGFEIEEVSDQARLEELAPEWDSLFDECPAATPFQSPQWLLPWMRHLGDGRPFALALRKNGALSALLPLMLRGEEAAFMGTGVSDYLDMLALPEAGDEAASTIFEYLLRRKDSWGRCALYELRAGSPLLKASPPSGLKSSRSAGEPCLVVNLLDRADKLGRRGPRSGKNGSKRTRRMLEESGELTVETANGRSLSGLLDSFFRLHEMRWRALGGTGVLNGPEIRSFHVEAASGLLEKGVLRLYRMRYRGADFAALYALIHCGRMYAYLNGFDPAFLEFSPGAHILRRAVEDAINEGVRELDFLRGGEKYKYAWGPDERRNSTLVIGHG
ncbi:MAG: GNAT family N-acetyltransferase [Deltaproteobacteria bacterium]|nr:GNAT family N-acetyltransferase [Deltaproteobacteria bacterium]MCL4874270.1 GNAT family N-acetyltransferase [bacterium]